MKNSKTGLVLSGGGTRGLAHAGVLKFLEEQQITPDLIACCSAGSIVGSLYAFGKKPEEILEFFKSVYFFDWKHFAFNKPGIVSSHIFKNYLDPIFKEKTLEDLNIDLRIVATELITGEQRTFSPKTRIVDAVIASSSVPGITTPYFINDEIFSDGGVLNNFPADIIKEECDRIIGVYVTPLQKIKAEDLKSIRAVTSRAYDLLSHRTEIYKFSYCDWFITSEKLGKYGTFEHKSSVLQEIFDIGYQEAKISFEINEAKFTSIFQEKA